MNEKKAPAIRFKGFANEWKEKTLDDLCELITKQTGFDYSTTIKPSLVMKQDEHTYPFIQNKDFTGNIINLDTDFFVPIHVADKFPRILIDKPSLLVSISGRIGNVGLYKLKKKAFVGGAVGICKLKNPDDGEFILKELESNYGQKHFHSLTKSSSHTNITVEDIRNIKIHIPINKSERDLISSTHLRIDRLIYIYQRKLEKLQLLKKSMLTKMFPKDGARVPEIRFQGFHDNWVQHQLGDVGSVAMCKRIFKDETSDKGDIPFFKIGTFGGSPDAYISRELFDEYKLKYPYPEIGDILLSASGTIGRQVEYKGEDAYYQDSNIIWLKHSKIISNKFLKVVYQVIKWNGIEGSTIQRLYNDNILKTKFFLPSLEEQEAIGDYFYNLDALISLQKNRFNKLEQIKQAMLSKLFV